MRLSKLLSERRSTRPIRALLSSTRVDCESYGSRRHSLAGERAARTACYSYFPLYGTIALFMIFGKNERSALSEPEARAIAIALRTIQAEPRRQFQLLN